MQLMMHFYSVVVGIVVKSHYFSLFSPNFLQTCTLLEILYTMHCKQLFCGIFYFSQKVQRHNIASIIMAKIEILLCTPAHFLFVPMYLGPDTFVPGGAVRVHLYRGTFFGCTERHVVVFLASTPRNETCL
jgi:hypothetical protein